MKNNLFGTLKYIALFSILLTGAFTPCWGNDIILADFESGGYGGWVVEGDAFGQAPATGALPGQQEVAGYQGQYLANSFNGGDDSRGSLTSDEFTIERDYINFLIGGGMRPDAYIELQVDGKQVQLSRPLFDSETLHWLTWDVKNYQGKKGVIRIMDNQRGAWGHILVDHIVMSNTQKSNIMVDYKLSFNIDKNYLLVPVEDKGPESQIHLQLAGKTVSPRLSIRVAQTKIDYWVPIEVGQYKGKELTLLFEHVKKEDIGYSQIKQSDTFEFDYNEQYRPVYHFSPQYGWTNDPNGMVYYNGEYHLYFQHNPYGSMWGNMNWGHAVTKDLKKWEYLPDAISPDSLGTIFSGSAVIDRDNTAGFGKNALVAIYTSAGEIQTQSIAYSLDNGRTFTKYENNPVLTNPNYVDFRDPKVFWHTQSNQWIMSLATTQTITFYGSKNLKEWIRLSEFGEGIGAHGGVWECPDLFPLTYNGQTKWVLFVSINPGGPNGGSATQYFIGSFDGKTFKPDSLPYPLWVDYGRDNYAGVTWNDAPNGRRIFIGWMSNWDYTNNVPSIHFRNAMTVPRELSLANNGKHLILVNQPVKEITELRGEAFEIGNLKVKENHTVDKLFKEPNGGAYEIEMTIIPQKETNFGFRLMNRKGESLGFTFNTEKGVMSVHREKSGQTDFSNNFAPKSIDAPLVKRDKYRIRLLIDNASSEIFINGGELVQTNTVFPTEHYSSMEFNTKSGKIDIEDIKVYTIH
ncbi:MAG: GH32 C-terminal domain-containing protein [Dysgonomonas sp.]